MNLNMLTRNGCGLAANQIGYNLQIFVAVHENKFYEIINPVILEAKGMQIEVEGCLSSDDGQIIFTKRPRRLKIQYEDRFGKVRKLSVRGRLAQIFSHEIDHLNGIYYKEREASGENMLNAN
jgi:peptide deformylase